MSYFILDATLVVRWLLEPSMQPSIKYAHYILDSLRENQAVVPSTWHIELANLLLQAERKRLIELHHVQQFLAQVDNLPISVDLQSHHEITTQTLALAREYQVSNFEAAYISLALRTGYPVATIQPELTKLLKRCNIAHY
jgi:predicted nucleic acid-binding protein